MLALAETHTALIDDHLAKRNAVVLAVAQALAGGNNTVIVATAGIIGLVLAPDKSLATLPISVMMFGLWFSTVPMGLMARNYGRRTALQIGTAVGAVSGLVCCVAVLQGSFALLLLGTFGCGFYAAGHMSYRFASTDTATDAYKPIAISYVLAGGVLAGVIGPSVVIFTKDLWPPYLFAATFIAQAGLALLAGLALSKLKLPPPMSRAEIDRGRPLGEIVRSPKFIVAVFVGVSSYTLMNLVMTSAPLAMVGCGHSVTDATLGIQWHVLGMYAPSFITGSLIARYGVNRIVALGLVMLLVSALVGIAGLTVAHFWISLTLLGVGWNFAFIGATTIVARSHRPEERTKVQSFNDFLIFGSMALGSLASGMILATYGWIAVNGVLFPPIVAAGALLLWLMIRERRHVSG
jgi:predicted MFS family arabinose efflux permease